MAIQPFHFRPAALALAAAGLFAIAATAAAAPRHVYLTFQNQDTARSITVNFHTMADSGSSPDSAEVYYDTEPRLGYPPLYRHRATGRRHKVEGLADGRSVHWVELANIEPGRTYYFIAGDPEGGYSAEKKFKTVPPGATTMRFVIGGDIGTGPGPVAFFKQAALQSPDAGLIGGDIAYENGELSGVAKWDELLDNWEQNMVTPEGYSIPMVAAIGNHEVKGSASRDPKRIPFYFGFLCQDFGRTHFTRRFGANTAFLALDSGHHALHGGAQSEWLDSELTRLADVPHRFPFYHVPLYPSHRKFNEGWSIQGRKFWQPLFEKHAVTACFEHHDHTFKRAKRIKGDKADPSGVLYLGDGCWGKGAREVDAELRWYLDKQASLAHFWRVDVQGHRVEYRAIDAMGRVFDVYPPGAEGSAEAEKVFTLLNHPEILF